jgi:branched-chain amino acid transport system permease protein
MLAGQIVNGLVSGAMYALVAIGFTLIIGVLDKLNFNHPEVFMFGGYVGLMALPHMSVAGAFAMAFLVGGLLGVLTEWMAFRRFVGNDARTTAALSSLADLDRLGAQGLGHRTPAPAQFDRLVV